MAVLELTTNAGTRLIRSATDETMRSRMWDYLRKKQGEGAQPQGNHLLLGPQGRP